jgi:membrane-associated phospholipid phosphatase
MSTRTTPAAPALPRALRRPLALAATPAALVVAVLGWLYSGDTTGGRVDRWLLPAIDGVRAPWRYAALVIDFCGEPAGSTILVASAALGFLALRRPRTAILTVTGVGLTVGATTLLKPVVGRTIHGGYLSFPSGHTAMATALSLVIALVAVEALRLDRPAGMLLVLAAVLPAGIAMGWAEVALGAHYPTDTLGGLCTALAVVPPAAWLIDRVAGRGARTGNVPAGTRPH